MFNGAEVTELGEKAAAAFKPEDNPRFRCETTSIIFDWTFDGPVNRITQSGDTITLQYGQLGFTRTIHLNAEHPSNIEPSRAGHSTGRWENDVLVVDTVGFAPGAQDGDRSGLGIGAPPRPRVSVPARVPVASSCVRA